MDPLETLVMSALVIGIVFAYIFYAIPQRLQRRRALWQSAAEREGRQAESELEREPRPPLGDDPEMGRPGMTEADERALNAVNELRALRGLPPLLSLEGGDAAPEQRADDGRSPLQPKGE